MFKFVMKDNIYKGKLIVFEGLDGAGKSTLLEGATKFLHKNNIIPYVTKAPSDSMRKTDAFIASCCGFVDSEPNLISKFSITLMTSGDRLTIQDKEVIPALEAGKWVLLDRYQFTGLTFSEDSIIRDVTERFIRPDLAFLANCPLEVSNMRVKARPDEADRFFENEELKYRKEVYEKIAYENDFFRIIDTSREASVAIQEVESQLAKLLD